LVVLDVLLNSLTLLLQFAALWRLRRIKPDIPRSRIPGGWPGLVIVTLLPAAVIVFAIVSQVVEEGLRAIWFAAVATAIGAVLYFPTRRYLKVNRGVPDVDPYVSDEPQEGLA
jgi:amino acid transporter